MPSEELEKRLPPPFSIMIFTATRWETQDTFLIWAIQSAHWTTEHRTRLPDARRGLPLLLFLEGHSSRKRPAALQLLPAFNVIVLFLPSHCSHLLQMFYPGLTAAGKRRFSIWFQRGKWAG
jgi:hypothetical protein